MSKQREKKQPVNRKKKAAAGNMGEAVDKPTGNEDTKEPSGEEILLEAIRLLPEDVLGQAGDAEEIIQQNERKEQKLRLLKWAAVAAVILLVLCIAWKSGVYPFGETNKQKQYDLEDMEESSQQIPDDIEDDE